MSRQPEQGRFNLARTVTFLADRSLEYGLDYLCRVDQSGR